MDKLVNEFVELRNEVSVYLDEKKEKLDIFRIKAITFIIQYLENLIYECKTGKLKPRQKRYDHIARIINDNESFLDPALSDRLIAAEQKYKEKD